jgi:hypothetical protein
LRTRDVVVTEACLDPVEMRQRLSGSHYTTIGYLGDIGTTASCGVGI